MLAVREAAAAVDKAASFESRGDTFSGANGGLSKGQAVTIRRSLGVETRELTKLSALLDAVLNAGAKTVANVEYRITNAEAAKIQAANLAAQRAQIKAQQIAKSLGVTLGDVVGVSQTEESAGTIFRERARQGTSPLSEADMDVKIFVSVDYALASGATAK